MVLDWYNVSIQRVFKFCLEKLEKRYEEMNYKKRRDEVLSKMEKNSVLVLYSGVRHHVSADEYAPFEANRNFFYLTGIRRENMMLILDNATEEPTETLLIEEADPDRERWMGKKMTVDEAKAAAKYTLEKMSGYTVKYPVAVDVESKYILDYLSVQDLTNVVNAFCDTIAAAGYTPIVYSDYSKFTNEMDTNQIKYDLWLARYGADGHYQGRTIWQCTDKGRVNGINGNVCLEFTYKDYAPKAAQGTAIDSGEWKQEGGKWYFYRDGGRMSGWVNPDGYWYYLDPAELGAMVTGTTKNIDGVDYTFNASGVMQ